MSVSTTERTRALRRRMIGEARRATVEHGLSGFTIEQLCESVGGDSGFATHDKKWQVCSKFHENSDIDDSLHWPRYEGQRLWGIMFPLWVPHGELPGLSTRFED